ncbi:bark storage protein A-like [Coffea eugenioides]|uniref:bark storage protein A-like n=1 Tax=Coffea eugenioides TaxID=49369 RepID=UPI000F614EC9|nr:bark storage protein A-like [Coffea eugenioides]
MAGKQMKLLLLVSVVISSLAVNVLAAPLPRAIKELSARPPFLGLISSGSGNQETPFSVDGAFKPDPEFPYVDLSGRRFNIGTIGSNSVIIVGCGAGLVNAAATTQLLLDIFPIRAVIHYGTAGGADSSLSLGDVLIPTQFSQTGLWDWLKSEKAPQPDNGVADLQFSRYHVPSFGFNLLGRVAYMKERFFSVTGEPDVPERKFWFPASENLLQIASTLEGIELDLCLAGVCLPKQPKLVLGVNGTTADFFVENAAYSNFLHSAFNVSSIDMESAAVIMTSLSNGQSEVIAIRGLANFAGAEEGEDSSERYDALLAINVEKIVAALVDTIPSPRLSSICGNRKCSA